MCGPSALSGPGGTRGGLLNPEVRPGWAPLCGSKGRWRIERERKKVGNNIIMIIIQNSEFSE